MGCALERKRTIRQEIARGRKAAVARTPHEQLSPKTAIRHRQDCRVNGLHSFASPALDLDTFEVFPRLSTKASRRRMIQAGRLYHRIEILGTQIGVAVADLRSV